LAQGELRSNGFRRKGGKKKGEKKKDMAGPKGGNRWEFALLVNVKLFGGTKEKGVKPLGGRKSRKMI